MSEFKTSNVTQSFDYICSELIGKYVLCVTKKKKIWCGLLKNKSFNNVILSNAFEVEYDDYDHFVAYKTNDIDMPINYIVDKIWLADVKMIAQLSVEIQKDFEWFFNKKEEEK